MVMNNNNFYSHALVGRDEMCGPKVSICANFYSHALVGRDNVTAGFGKWSDISTHTPSWGVTENDIDEAMLYENFYSHALVGRDRKPEILTGNRNDFYSHALVGRDALMSGLNTTNEISTHTPSWGVTPYRPRPILFL